MDFLEEVKQWVAGFPGWEEAAIHIDYVSPDPENGALLPKGLEVIGFTEDVLGNRKARMGCAFLLQRVACDTGITEAEQLLRFQQWVYESCAAGNAPQLGENTRWRAEKGQLSGNKGVGTGLYTVLLTAEFTKEYLM